MKCYYCKKVAVVGRKTCEFHAEKKRNDAKKQRDKRRKLGLCTMCGGERDTKLTHCCECQQKQKESYTKRRIQRIQNNLCTVCNRDKSIISCWTNTRCPGCHFKEKFKWSGTKDEAEQIINSMLETQNHKCALSGRDLKINKFHIDHIIPKSVDKTKIADPENWQLIVEDANFFKKDGSVDDIVSICVDIAKHALATGRISLSDLTT